MLQPSALACSHGFGRCTNGMAALEWSSIQVRNPNCLLHGDGGARTRALRRKFSNCVCEQSPRQEIEIVLAGAAAHRWLSATPDSARISNRYCSCVQSDWVSNLVSSNRHPHTVDSHSMLLTQSLIQCGGRNDYMRANEMHFLCHC